MVKNKPKKPAWRLNPVKEVVDRRGTEWTRYEYVNPKSKRVINTSSYNVLPVGGVHTGKGWILNLKTGEVKRRKMGLKRV
jgi:hypothetical protein